MKTIAALSVLIAGATAQAAPCGIIAGTYSCERLETPTQLVITQKTLPRGVEYTWAEDGETWTVIADELPHLVSKNGIIRDGSYTASCADAQTVQAEVTGQAFEDDIPLGPVTIKVVVSVTPSGQLTQTFSGNVGGFEIPATTNICQRK